MNPSQLTNLVTFEKPTRTADGAGGWTETWSEVFTDFAQIVPATASNLERRVGDHIEGRTTHLVTLRFYPGVSLEWRVKWEDRYSPDGVPATHYAEIRGSQNWGNRSSEMTLACEEQIQ